jgi:NADP-dependent 3-hydroxy acid dehydrogenase YdfG
MNKTNPGVALVTGASSGIGYATAKALQSHADLRRDRRRGRGETR